MVQFISLLHEKVRVRYINFSALSLTIILHLLLPVLQITLDLLQIQVTLPVQVPLLVQVTLPLDLLMSIYMALVLAIGACVFFAHKKSS